MGESTAVYELRIYHVVPGKMENLVARFRDHTMRLFADHGIKSSVQAVYKKAGLKGLKMELSNAESTTDS